MVIAGVVCLVLLFLLGLYEARTSTLLIYRFKDGDLLNTDLDPNLRVHADGRRLEILGARVSDKGAYTCVGENIAGSIEWDFDVDVHGKCLFFYPLTYFTQMSCYVTY